MEEQGLTDMHKTLAAPKTHILESSEFVAFTTDHIRGHKTNLNTFRSTEIIWSVFVLWIQWDPARNQWQKDNNKISNAWKLSNIKNPQVREEVPKENFLIHWTDWK